MRLGSAVGVVVDVVVRRERLVVGRAAQGLAHPLEDHAVEVVQVGARSVQLEHPRHFPQRGRGARRGRRGRVGHDHLEPQRVRRVGAVAVDLPGRGLGRLAGVDGGGLGVEDAVVVAVEVLRRREARPVVVDDPPWRAVDGPHAVWVVVDVVLLGLGLVVGRAAGRDALHLEVQPIEELVVVAGPRQVDHVCLPRGLRGQARSQQQPPAPHLWRGMGSAASLSSPFFTEGGWAAGGWQRRPA
mmetsp:Transcript_24651/g.70984  ORF Transcript_24651/g.70984 Transcript_24651/m.70984 type:complete len:242 (+) Transcript_24651:782-1507(+)